MAAFGFPLYLLGKETDAAKNKKRRMKALAFIQFFMLAAVIASACLDVARKPSGKYNAAAKGPSGLSLFNTTEKISALPVSIQSLSLPSSVLSWPSDGSANDPESKKGSDKEYIIANLVSYPNAHIEYDNYEDALKDTGKNHGNLVWQFATMNRLVDFTSVTTCNNTRLKCQSEIDLGGKQMMFYRPIANIFDITSTMKFAYERLIVERDGDALLFVGIGIQQFFQPDIRIDDLNPGEKIRTTPKDFKFSEHALKMLKTLQEHKLPMFVRGQFTLEAARHAGYKYGLSTGCPSLFINQDVHLGRSLEQKYNALKERTGDYSLKIALNMKPQRKLTDFFISVLNAYPNSYMYAQTLDDLNQMKKAKIPFSRIKFISDAEEWMDSLREMDVAFGARIHGNMIALGAGIPGFVIAPDHRVLELVERMKIPHTTIYDERLKEGLDVAKLITDIGFSGADFDSNRCGIAKTYNDVFGRYGLPLSRHAQEISTIC
ncbi:Polysaccharide pyruvyl transferase [Gracilaria domingensis]|nr:Polysaccharide pyruvyl transferase [Gracilaria domingensis]